MEIAWLCDVKVLLCIVDKKNEKKVLFTTDELKYFYESFIKNSLSFYGKEDVRIKK